MVITEDTNISVYSINYSKYILRYYVWLTFFLLSELIRACKRVSVGIKANPDFYLICVGLVVYLAIREH